jgi:Tol biopolymer transport system component/DNA-binding winged helix-turn-helix (wHTH) protein
MPSPARPQEHKTSPDEQIIRFDRYQLDLHSGELRKEGRKVRIQAQPFQLLVLLLRNAGRVVSREDVRRELWPADTFVDFDHGLAAAVNKIRDALCDSADKPKFVETLPRRGYRFVGKLEPESPVEIRLKLEEVPAPELNRQATVVDSHPQAGRGSRVQAWTIVATLILLGMVTTAAIIWVEKPEPKVEEWNVTQFTSYAGETHAPAFSPDGSRIAFGWESAPGKNDLYVKALGGEALLQLTHHPASAINPAWSPDGTQIAFMRLAGPDTGLYMVPALGGPEQKLQATSTPYEYAAPVSWSPDGKSIAYGDLIDKQVGDRMFLFSMETHQSRLFFHDPACAHESQLTFSNTGNQVAWLCVRKLDEIDLMVGDPQGKTRRLIRTVNVLVTGMSWMPDDSKLIINQQRGERGELFEVTLSDGNMKLAEAAKGDLHTIWPAVSAKTGALAWATWGSRIGLVRVDLQNPKATVEPILESSRDQKQASFSPDHKHIAFESNRSGSWQVWVGDADGSNLTPISNGWQALFPRWSPDSRRLIYFQKEGETQFIYVMDIDERVPHKLLTSTREVGSPFWSLDGKWIYFQDESSFFKKYFRCSLDCNRNETLVRDGPRAVSMQPTQDGKYFYYVFADGPLKVFRETLNGDHLGGDHLAGPEEVEGIPPLAENSSMFVARKGIYFVSAAKPTVLEYFDFATRKTKEMVKMDKKIVGGVWVSSDDRYALVPQLSDSHQDLMLAEPKR